MNDKSKEKQKQFSNHLTDILNYGALNLALAIGYKTRLFDAMDTFSSPRPASEIAEKAEANERYVREWLGVMVSGGIVELTQGPQGEDLFFLPREHGDLITRRVGSWNLGVYTQEIPLLTQCAMAPVMEGFQTGHGVGYHHYPAFHEFMAQLANAKHNDVLVQEFLPAVDNGNIIKRLSSGIRVCDLGCAEGVALILMAEAFPKSEFVGIDISQAVLEKAQKDTEKRKLQNVAFIDLDAAILRDNPELFQSFDYVTAFDAIHDQTRPLEALKGIHAILKPNGLFSMVDIAASSRLSDNMDHPMASFLYTVSLMHCLPIGLQDGGEGLGMMWGREKAVEMLKAAGFKTVNVSEIEDDPFNLHYLCRKTE